MVETLSGILFGAFITRWFIPTLQLPAIFGWAAIAAILCLLIAAWIPDKPGRVRYAHRFFAYAMAALMMTLVGMLLLRAHLSTISKATTIAALLIMAITWYTYLFIRQAMRYYLFFQAGYIGSFFAVIMLATYIR